MLTRFMKKNYKVIIFLLLVISFVFLPMNYEIKKAKVLIIKDVETNTKNTFLAPNQQFVLSYIHSVHHTPAYEIFHITEDNKLLLTETRYYSLGVGMPVTAEGGKFTNEEGEFVIKFNRKFDNLRLRISPIPKHAIKIGDKTYSLLDFTAPEKPIEITASDKWILAQR